MFTTAENLVQFDPVGPEDEPMAEQESDYVNYQFFKKNDAFLVLYNWFFDALVQKNGIVKVYWDDYEDQSVETYENLTMVELDLLLADEELEEMEVTEKPFNAVPGMGEQPVMIYDAQFKRTRKMGKVCVENVPPEEYRISRDARSVCPDDARMVGQECQKTRSELIEMGLSKKKAYELTAGTNIGEITEEKLARYDNDAEELNDAPQTEGERKVTVYEAYIKVDYDGDGVSERRHVIMADDEILVNEYADRQIYHVISPQPLPHRHFGRASAEKVMDVQRVSTTLLRQVLTNLYHTNNPGHAVWEQGIGEDTLDDLLTTRIGRVARFRRPVNESYSPMEVPFTAAASFPMMEYFDKVKRDRTGVSSDAEGLKPDQLKNIQQSVMAQQMDLSRMKIEAICRIFAETGIKSCMMHIHELVRKHQNKEEIVRIRGKWVQVDPREWRQRYDMTVKIGLGIGTREQNLMQLTAIKDLQAQIVENGGMGLLVTPQNIYQTAAEFVKNANLKDPQQFFTDPGDQQAPPPNEEQMQLQKQQQELQAQQQKIVEQQQALEIQRVQLDAKDKEVKAEQNQTKMMIDAQKERENLQIEHKKVTNKMIVDMEKLSNELTKMELDYNRQLPGGKA
jgi:hypothetical protein